MVGLGLGLGLGLGVVQFVFRVLVNQHGLGTSGRGIESSVGRRPKRTQKSILGLGLAAG